ncbi:hypothetical protein BH10ACI1_BH10ACI1_03280 [soil metagenome]
MKSSLMKASVTLLFLVLVCNSQAVFARTNLNREIGSSWVTLNQTGVTMRSYRRIKIGMSLATVNDIIGFNGSQMSRSVGGGKVFTSYKWEGRDYAIITAVFKDYILTNKYEANLR